MSRTQPKKAKSLSAQKKEVKPTGIKQLKGNVFLLWLILTFIISRLLYRNAGIQFDHNPLDWFWQYIDPYLLRTDFARSIFYLHAQPPLMNIFLGTVINIFSDHQFTVFWLCYLILGITLTITLYLLLKSIGIAPLIATGLVAIFIVSPACILYENWLFYTYPICVTLVVSALMWVKFTQRPRFIYALLFFTGLGLTALLWSLFHLIWILGCAIVLLFLHPGQRKHIILSLIITLALVGGWYTKNLLLYRQFTASTWWGMNFSKMTNSMLSFKERQAIYHQAIISEISLIPPFSELTKYQPYIGPDSLTDIPILDLQKKMSGAPNFNHLAYIKIARSYGKDAFKILFTKPTAYLRGLTEAIGIFFVPADYYYFLKPNREKIQTFARIFNLIFLGNFNTRINSRLRTNNPLRYYLQSFTNTGLWLIAAYLLTLVLGYRLKRQNPGLYRALLFCWLTISYAFLVGNFTEVGENNRFRFALDPLVIPFIAITIQNILPRYFPRTR